MARAAAGGDRAAYDPGPANNVGPTTLSTRVPMLVAMACFLVMAIAVPDVFGSGAWLFAIGQLAHIEVLGAVVGHLIAGVACLALSVVGVTVNGSIQLALSVVMLVLLMAGGWRRTEDTRRQQVSTA